ncbi:RDD family protein [Oceanipulchritudo coccoides]|nr:RDD family protein [Oceanipulchritudo coccoides]
MGLLGGMLDENVTTEEFLLEETRPAGFWIRVAAYFIDFLILLVFGVLALFIKSVPAYILLMIPLIAYKPVLEGILGGTAGKLAIGLRVINAEGQRIGVAGGFVRSGLFILPIIPNMLLQIKMIEQGLSPFDPAAMVEFQQSNELLYYVYYGLSALMIISCVVVAFTAHKRGLHDMVADSYVIYLNKETPGSEG